MKIKIIILIAISAVVTLSFTFASANKPATTIITGLSNQVSHEEPIGGFASEDKL